MLVLCSPVDVCESFLDIYKELVTMVCVARQCYTIYHICIEKEREISWIMHKTGWPGLLRHNAELCETDAKRKRNFGLKCATCVYVVTHNFNGQYCSVRTRHDGKRNNKKLPSNLRLLKRDALIRRIWMRRFKRCKRFVRTHIFKRVRGRIENLLFHSW